MPTIPGYVYRIERPRTGGSGEVLTSYGTYTGDKPWDARELAERQVCAVRVEHRYFGPLVALVWAHRGHGREHFRMPPPHTAWRFEFDAVQTDEEAP